MWEAFLNLLKTMGPLSKKLDPSVAVVVGLIFGGIGLGIYLKSIVDFVIPIIIAVIFVGVWGDPGWFVGACLAGAYGYFRVKTSNEMLEQQAA